MVHIAFDAYDASVMVLSPGQPGSTDSPLDPGFLGPGADRSIAQTVERHISRLVPGAIIVSAAEGVGGILAAEPALLVSTVLSTAFGLAMVAAGHLSKTGRAAAVPPLLALSVYLLGLAGAVLVPGSAQVAAMLPILSVVLLLPGQTPRGAIVLGAVAVAGSVLALLSGDLPHPFAPMREPAASLFQNGALLGVTGLILVTLMDFAAVTKRSTDRLRQALRAEEAAFAERTAIIASLGRLERKSTIEETAALIVAALRRLHEIDLAAVFGCDDQHVEVLAMAGPEGFPARSGDRLPDARASHLLARMVGGPWAERWEGDPAFAQYGEAITATGILGQAFAPFYDGDRLVGAVAIGTRSAEQAEHLLADLPAVAEFAATTAVLLTPMLRERAEAIAARKDIETIIASGAYRPVFQPVVELASGRIVGFEALTRFADGRRPDLVFAEAARTGVGFQLEFATIEAAIAAGRELPDGTWLSLNVSPALLVEAAGLDALMALRDRPVVLEITEHVTIDDYRAVRSAIDRLGPDVRTAVDDAGAGIANFSHLVELRPGIVKIDSGMIRDLDTDLARQAVLVGLVHFAAKAGCEVIAEGIETEGERVTAAALGVTHGQGFLFARPAPVATFSAPAGVSAQPVVRRRSPSRPASVTIPPGGLAFGAGAKRPLRQVWPDPQSDRSPSN